LVGGTQLSGHIQARMDTTHRRVLGKKAKSVEETFTKIECRGFQAY